MKPERIPLFPLKVVLFPGTQLPLHIFEARYKLMVSRCVEEELEFGVVLTTAGEIASTGCTAEINRILRKYPDGRMDIATTGRDVFKIIRLVDEKPYYEAIAEYLADASAADQGAAPLRGELLEAFQACHQRAFDRPGDVPADLLEDQLSYYLAAELPLELPSKQRLLELRSEPQRRAVLLEVLRAWLPQLERAERTRGKAAGNGHAQL
jgi:ATP-dependent Lon protease